jgi:hypothetical protein
VWEFSNEHPSPPLRYPTTNRVTILINTFLQDKYFGRVLLVKKKILGNMFRKSDNNYIVLTKKEDILRLGNQLSEKCQRDFLSVIFVPVNPENFLNDLLAKGHYGQPTRILVGDSSIADPLGSDDRVEKMLFLENSFESGEILFSFSHDADYLYQIFR